MAKAQSLSPAYLSARSADGSALGSLWTLIGGDKHAVHGAIVTYVGTILALAMCDVPPKGHGNPADHGKLAQVFEASKVGKKYAPYCAAFPQALKGRMRSLKTWGADGEEGTAVHEGLAIAMQAFADLAPKTYTDEQEAERAAKREAKKAERAKEEKAAAKEERALRAAELANEFAKGVASVNAPVLTAQMVADMVRAGAFDSDGLAIIRAALPIGQTVETVTAEQLAITG